MNRDRNRGGGSSSQQTDDQAPDMTDQYAENLRRYNEYMEGQQPRSSGKGGPATMPQTITPEMRQAALQTFGIAARGRSNAIHGGSSTITKS